MVAVAKRIQPYYQTLTVRVGNSIGYRGRSPVNTKRKAKTDVTSYTVAQLFVAYLDRIAKTFRKRFVDALAHQSENMIDITDITNELTLLRISAEDSVELLSLVTEVEEAAAAIDPKQQIQGLHSRINAGDILEKRLVTVANVARTAAQIRQAQQDIKDIGTLQEVFAEVAKAARESIYDDTQLKAFLLKLRNLKMPEDGTQGTTLTPDADVIAMDNATLGVPIPDPKDFAELNPDADDLQSS